MEPITITIPDEQGALDRAEAMIITEVLRRRGTIAETAEALGITRHALKRRLVKYEVPHSSQRGGWRPRARKAEEATAA